MKELKGNGKTRDIPVVMYTTSGDRTHAEIILAMGADYYMQKTNGFNELCLELERLFQTLEKDLQARNDLKTASAVCVSRQSPSTLTLHYQIAIKPLEGIILCPSVPVIVHITCVVALAFD